MPFGNAVGEGFVNPAVNKIAVIDLMPGDGIFLYAPAIALNDLIASITAQAGVDGVGNTYLEGITAYSVVGGQVYATQLGSQNIAGTVIPAFFTQNLASLPNVPASFAGNISSAAGCSAIVYSGKSVLGSNPAFVQVQDSTESGQPNGAVNVGGAISFNGNVTMPASLPSITSLPNDGNSGSTWVSGERAFMNNNWVANVNANFSAIVNALASVGIFV